MFVYRVQKNTWIIILAALFTIINGVAMFFDTYFLNLLPPLLLAFLLLLFSFDKFFYLITFLTPISVSLEDKDFGFGIYFPSEFLMIMGAVLFIFKILYQNPLDRRIMKHPISLAIIFYLLWMFLTSITSELPVVSFKHLLIKIWYVIMFFYLATQVFAYQANIKKFLWLYVATYTIVIVYTLVGQIEMDFDKASAYEAMKPFFYDHGGYSAVIAMFLPFLFTSIYQKDYMIHTKILIVFLTIIYLFALYFSYARAAVLSLVVAVGVTIIFVFKVKKILVIGSVLTITTLLLIFQDELLLELSRNKKSSESIRNTIVQHYETSTNITTDVSNLERLNRWQCAFSMFAERPLTGFGPATYMFLYAPYQLSHQITSISTNNADNGNAHSEYFNLLADEGLPGMLSFIWLIITSALATSRIYFNKLFDKKLRQIALAIFLGLVTYFAHGALNNYLDTDKVSVLFWGFLAIIAAIEVYHVPQKEVN